MGIITRYCQRCSFPQHHPEWSNPNPCHKCGGVQFGALPKVYTGADQWTPTTEDAVFLRCQRIDPEAE